MTRMNSS